MLPADVVISRFAESVGREGEVRHYLEHWQSQTPERFALIDVSRLRSDPEIAALMADLHYLAAIKLTPILVGVGREVRAELTVSGLDIAEVGEPAEAASAARAGKVASAASADLSRWAAALAVRKVIVLGEGGLRDSGGALIPLVNVTLERDALAAAGALAPGHAPLFATACALIDAAKSPLSVGLTTPFDLLRELFTVRGAGTLLRAGSRIRAIASPTAAETSVLISLLEDAFGRRLRRDFLARPRAALLVADDFRGAAIVEPDQPAPYLSKFAVTTDARGDGVGRDLWRELVRVAPRFIWRARARNPIIGWYAANADGLHRGDPYTIFWRGLATEELPAAISHARARPDDFEP